MKVSLNWLRDYVDINVSINEIAEKLTMAGLEVASIQVIGDNWQNVVVGRIAAINPHPNADRLRLATVDLGDKQQTVVCGAPNLSIGDKIAFAFIGAELIDGHNGEKLKLKPAKIRGVVSEGMVCSERELGISENHEGILVLSPDAAVGTPLADVIGDTVIDIDVTPNRPDCLSVIGIAREISALTGSSLHIPELSKINTEASQKTIDNYVNISIAEPVLCPRYCASLLTNVNIGPSPEWLQQRLLACGMRPINNVVDVTNYVMQEYGQPLHAFDFREINDGKIIVRRASNNEVIKTLDGIERTLNSDNLVIADSRRALAIAGIMGGEGSEVADSTSTILIESANFNQAVIHKGSISLKLSSEASLRFEKGLSLELPMAALIRATQLMKDLSGAKVVQGIADVYPGKSGQQAITVSTKDVKRLIGIDIDMNRMQQILESLGFTCVATDNENSKMYVNAPWWRTDITCTADIVEEIARIFGYDNIPVTMLSAPIPTGVAPPLLAFRQKLKDILVTCGFSEILTYSLIGIESIIKLSPQQVQPEQEPAKISYPMSKELELLRTTLRPGLLTTLSRNEKYQQKNIKLFEMGKIFLPRKGDLPLEREMLCVVLTGLQSEQYWNDTAVPVDFYYTKGVAQTLLSRLGLSVQFLPGNDDSLSPGQSCTIISASTNIGVIGELHPKVHKAFDLIEKAYIIEFDVGALFALMKKSYQFVPVPRYPAVIRDIALVVDDHITYEKIEEIFKEFPLINSISLFDLYRGEQIPPGKKSLAFKLVFQSQERTLTDTEIDKIQVTILSKLQRECGAALRA